MPMHRLFLKTPLPYILCCPSGAERHEIFLHCRSNRKKHRYSSSRFLSRTRGSCSKDRLLLGISRLLRDYSGCSERHKADKHRPKWFHFCSDPETDVPRTLIFFVKIICVADTCFFHKNGDAAVQIAQQKMNMIAHKTISQNRNVCFRRVFLKKRYVFLPVFVVFKQKLFFRYPER